MPEWPAGWSRRNRSQLGRRAGLGRHAVADVGAVEAAEEGARIVQAEPRCDLAPGRRIGGRGQRDPGHLGPALAQDGELQILRAEVVAPLRDAVRLVDREQRERELVEPGEETVAEEPLGRDVEQVDRAGRGPRADPALLLGREAGVQELGADAELAQRRHLVLHQGDQRADDDRGAGAQQGRDLVAQRLAAARGHHDEGVAAVHDAAHDLLLLAPEGAEAEDVAQDRARIGRRARGIERISHGRAHLFPSGSREVIANTDG